MTMNDVGDYHGNVPPLLAPSDKEKLRRLITSAETTFAGLSRQAGLDPSTAFEGADLRNLDFSGEDLAGFSFRDADVRGADFTAALNVDLVGARQDNRTQLPAPKDFDRVAAALRYFRGSQLPPEWVPHVTRLDFNYLLPHGNPIDIAGLRIFPNLRHLINPAFK